MRLRGRAGTALGTNHRPDEGIRDRFTDLFLEAPKFAAGGEGPGTSSITDGGQVMQQCYSYVARTWQRAPVHAARAEQDAAGGDPRLVEVVSYIEEHLDDPDLGVDRLQSAFCISRATLYRMFTEIGGVARFIRRQRLVAARQYLRRRPDLGITWLLYELGFGSERQFQRAFQAEYGVSPSEWRERCKAAQDASPGDGPRRPSPYSTFAVRGANA